MVDVYCCRNEPVNEELWMTWLKLMPPAFREKTCRLTHRQDAQASLIGRLLLLYGLRFLQDGGLLLTDICLDAYHRPHFSNGDFDFNISHSGNYVVCAIGRNCRVGIDIEEIKPIALEDFMPLFSRVEWDGLDTHLAGRLDAFYDLWTQKEALVKAEGSGLNLPLLEVVIKGGRSRLRDQNWLVQALNAPPGYKAHLAFCCLPGDQGLISMRRVGIPEIMGSAMAVPAIVIAAAPAIVIAAAPQLIHF
jgi:4'-phosphopantetheinyl transferase